MKRKPAVIRAGLAALSHTVRSRRALLAYQDALLRRLVQHAYANTTYYQTLWDRAGITPAQIRGVGDLVRLPFSSKADIRTHPVSDIMARGYDPARLLTTQTSGSSGVPFTIHRTWLEGAVQYLFRLRSSYHFGGLLGRVALVGVDWPDDPNDPKHGERLLGALGVDRTRGINGLMAPERVVDELRAWQPHVIIAMPGILGHAADYIVQHGVHDVCPRTVIVGGEVLTQPLRTRLERAFGTRVFETYGSHEFPLMGWECPEQGGLHGCDDGVVLEILRDGRPAEPGESGDVVVTNLHAYAMPFIRYRIGDLATRGDTPCQCGQPFATIRAIEGRIVDQIVLPNDRRVHPYYLLTLLPHGSVDWMAQYQLFQERRDRLEFRIVAATAPKAADIAQFEVAARDFLGSGVTFEVKIVDDIPLKTTGKYRSMRSLVGAEEALTT